MDVITDVDTFTASVPIPEDAVDDVDATTVNQGLQALANRTKYLFNRLAHLRIAASINTGSDAASTLTSSNQTAFGTGDLELTGAGLAVISSDIVRARYDFSAADSVSGDAEFQLVYTINGGAKTVLPGSRYYAPVLGTSALHYSLAGAVTLGAVGTATLAVWLQIRQPGGTTTVNVYSPNLVAVDVLRVTA